MVYFPDTGNPATADTTTAAAVWIERIDSEYREMPGLRLTLAQAARLWGLQAPQCRALLGALVEPSGHVVPPTRPIVGANATITRTGALGTAASCGAVFRCRQTSMTTRSRFCRRRTPW